MMYAMKQSDQEALSATSAPNENKNVPLVEEPSWTDELEAFLDQAATSAMEHNADHDKFMMAAHEAYLRANPELREHIERTNILMQMESLRRLGLLPLA